MSQYSLHIVRNWDKIYVPEGLLQLIECFVPLLQFTDRLKDKCLKIKHNIVEPNR